MFMPKTKSTGIIFHSFALLTCIPLKNLIEFSSHVFNSELLEAVDIEVVATELHACANSSNPAILRYEHSKLT